MSQIITPILLLVLLCASIVIFGVWGIYVFFAAIVLQIAYYKGRTSAFFWFLLLILAGIPFFIALIPVDGSARELPVEKYRCESRLRSIACSLWNYESKYGVFPPAIVPDESGKPMHSWRVLLLPFLDGDINQSLYEQYDFAEPWDGPNNRKLFNKCPELYICRDALGGEKPETSNTSYLAVIGGEAAWPSEGAFSLKEERLRDRAGSTIFLIETTPNENIKWTQPKDFSLDDLKAGRDVPVLNVLHKHRHKGNFFFDYDTTGSPRSSVAILDMSGSSLSEENLTPDRLAKLLAIGGCDADNDCGPSKIAHQTNRTIRVNWLNCGALVTWLVSFGLLMVFTHAMRKSVAGRISDDAETDKAHNVD